MYIYIHQFQEGVHTFPLQSGARYLSFHIQGLSTISEREHSAKEEERRYKAILTSCFIISQWQVNGNG